MIGLLIINEFLRTKKFEEIYDILIRTFRSEGITLIMRTNVQLICDVGMDNISQLEVEFILFWDKDIILAKHCENMGYKTYNSSAAIESCDDKGLMAIKLERCGISMPRTIIAPFTYENIGFTNMNFIYYVAETLRFPMVVKESKGSFGQQVYLVNNLEELIAKTVELVPRNIIYQEYIKSSCGVDARLQVIGNSVVSSVRRFATSDDFRANVTIGGRMEEYNAPNEFVDMALLACSALGVDFGGVDILFGEDNRPILCEVNSNAHFKSILNATGKNIATDLARYIKAQLL